MTSSSVRSARQASLARVGLVLAAVGVMIAAANFFASMVPVDLGLSPDIEPMIVMMHAGAAILALGLLLIRVGRPAIAIPALRHPLVLASLAVSVWSMLLAPFAEFPLNSLLGSPSSGEGALMYAEIALFMAAAMVLRRFRVGAWVAGVGVGVGAVVPALIAGRVGRPEFLAEYVSFFAPASAALAIAACRRVSPRSSAMLGLVAGMPALILSNNNTVWGAAVIAFLSAGLIVWVGRDGSPAKRQRHRWLAASLVPAALAVVTLGVAFAGYEGLVRSLIARLYLDRIALEAIWDKPLTLLIGQGWGRASEIINIHFNASGAVLWDGNWDATTRRYTDLHNVVFESLLAAGVPAFLGILAITAMVPFYARRGLLPVATGFATAIATLLALWFQVVVTVPLIALASGWLVRPARFGRGLRGALGVRSGWTLVLLVCAIASSAAAGWLATYGLAVRHAYFESAAPNGPVACEDIPLDLDRGSFTLAQAFADAYQSAFADMRTGKSVSAERMHRTERLLCAVGRAAGKTRSADLLIMPLLFRGEIVFDPALSEMRGRFSDIFPTWERALDRFLVRAPRRTDMAWPYLSWQLERGDYPAVLAFARRLLARDPDDPVGLWFSGMVLVSSPDSAIRANGLGLLRHSLATGIERVAPIPDELKVQIKEQ